MNWYIIVLWVLSIVIISGLCAWIGYNAGYTTGNKKSLNASLPIEKEKEKENFK